MKPSSRHPCSPGGRCPAHSALPAIRPPRCHLPSTWRLSLPPLGRCKARVGQEPAGDPTDENAPESVFLSVQCGLDRHGRRQSFAVQVFRYTRAEKYKPFPKAKVVLLSFAVLGGEVERGSLHKRMWDCSFTFLSFLGSWCILFPTPRARARNDLPTDAPALSGFGSKSLSRRAFKDAEASLCAHGSVWSESLCLREWYQGRGAHHITPTTERGSLPIRAPRDTRCTLSHNVPRLLT